MEENIYRIIEKEHDNRRNKLLCKDSRAEKHFAQLLRDSNIFYIPEQCYYNHFGNWVYIDFYIPLYKIAIEIDGKEHFYSERKRKDIVKTSFLAKDRGIKTVRFTNEQCMEMSKISIEDIIGRTKMSDKLMEYIDNCKSREISRVCFDYVLPIGQTYWLYDKTKDHTYFFKDIYEMKHSTGTSYKYLTRAIDQDIDVSNLYIISTNKQELESKVEMYYNKIWDGVTM